MQQGKYKQIIKEAIKSSWICKFAVWLNDKIFKPVIIKLKGGKARNP